MQNGYCTELLHVTGGGGVLVISLTRKQKHILNRNKRNTFFRFLLQVHVAEGESQSRADGRGRCSAGRRPPIPVQQPDLFVDALKQFEAFEDDILSDPRGFPRRSAEFFKKSGFSGLWKDAEKCEMRYIQLRVDRTLVSAGTPDLYRH